MLQLVAEHLQTQGPRAGRHPTGGRSLCQAHQLDSGGPTIAPPRQFPQGRRQRLHPGRRDGGRPGIAFEDPQGGGATGVSEDLRELGKQHRKQGVDLVLVAGTFGGQLAVQPLQFALAGDQLVRHIAHARLATQEQAGDGAGIEPVGLGAQAALLGELVGLAWMQQTQGIALLGQKLVEIFIVARGRFQPNQDAAGLAAQGVQRLVQLPEADPVSSDLAGLDHGTFVGLADRVEQVLTAHIDAHPISKAAGIDWGCERIGGTHLAFFLVGLLARLGRRQHTDPQGGAARDDPAPQGERDLMLDSQSCGPAGRTHAVTSPIAAWCSGGWGTVYRRWSLASRRTGQRDRRRFSQGFHQTGSSLALHTSAASTNYYMRTGSESATLFFNPKFRQKCDVFQSVTLFRLKNPLMHVK